MAPHWEESLGGEQEAVRGGAGAPSTPPFCLAQSSATGGVGRGRPLS